MSLLALIPKLLEKTQQGKIGWRKSPTSDLNYMAENINGHAISIEQIVCAEGTALETFYFIKLWNTSKELPFIEFMEKVEVSKISALIKEVRSSLINKNYTSKLDELKNYLDTL